MAKLAKAVKLLSMFGFDTYFPRNTPYFVLGAPFVVFLALVVSCTIDSM